MIAVFNQFQRRLEQLRSFIDSTQAINAIVSTNLPRKTDENDFIKSLRPHLVSLKKSPTVRKIYAYASSVFLLYGLFEQYVEELVIAYLLELEQTIPKFDDMPEKIKESHTEFSAQLLLNNQIDKYRDRFTPKEVVRNMQLCINNGRYRLNTLAFIDHKSNFRIDPLNQFFASVGISGIAQSVKSEPEFKRYIAKRFPGSRIEGVINNVIFEDLNDLAWRRNVVAHGWPMDATLSVEMMDERAEFIQHFCGALYGVVRQEALKHIVTYQGRALPKPIVVHDNRIVCFNLNNVSISKDDKIISRTSTGRYLEGKIIEIQINGVPKINVSTPPALDVACRVDFKAKNNQEYFLIKKIKTKAQKIVG